MRCTGLPASEFRNTGRVAVRVFPSPVFISAIAPSRRTMPPISCTSKWRWPRVRRAASRQSANASGRRSSSGSPLRARSRRPSASLEISPSSSSSISGSKRLMEATRLSYSLNCRPSPRRSARSISPFATTSQSSGRPGADSGRAAPEAVHQPTGLMALATLLAMPLHLAAQVLRGLVNRVQHLGGGLPGTEGDPLQMQGGLCHLAVGDRGIPLLGQLDLEYGELGDLLADPREALLDVSAKLVGDLRVPSPDLNPHAPSSLRSAGFNKILRRCDTDAKWPNTSSGPREREGDHPLGAPVA